MLMNRERGIAASGARLGLAAAVLLVAVVGPARAEDDDLQQPSWSDKLSNKLKDSISGAENKLGFGKPPGPPPKESPSGCPTIGILPGTESQRVMANAAAGNQGVRYQFSLANVGRECTISGNRVSVKVGADGRVLLGPAGSAGRFDVPIRVVVYSEAQQKTVESKLFRVSASIGAGQSATPFSFVSDSLVVPIAGGSTAADYSIKVGFDSGKGGGEVVKSKRGRRAKPAASAAAN